MDYIVTELCVIHVTDQGFELMEIAPGLTVEELQAQTEAKLIVPADLKEMSILA